MGSSPRVSVVVPVRDRRELLCTLLDSLDRQSYQDFEVVVVDDGSLDGSGELARQRTLHGRPVRLVSRSHEGAVAARRAGVTASVGEIVAFTDSDCEPQPRWLEYAVAAIDAGADLVNGMTRPARPPRPLERSMWSVNDGLYPTCNVTYRRRAYEDAGGFDPVAARSLGYRHHARAVGLGFGEDTMLAWRVRRAGIAVYEPRAVVLHQVFAPDVVETLSRAWMAGAFPALVREVPELAEPLLRHGIQLGRRSRLPVYAFATAMLACRRHRRLARASVLMWWVGSRFAELRHPDIGLAERARATLVEMGVDVVTAAALLSGSLRARRLVV